MRRDRMSRVRMKMFRSPGHASWLLWWPQPRMRIAGSSIVCFSTSLNNRPGAFGADTLDQLTDKFRRSQFNIRHLLIEIAVIAAEPISSGNAA